MIVMGSEPVSCVMPTAASFNRGICRYFTPSGNESGNSADSTGVRRSITHWIWYLLQSSAHSVGVMRAKNLTVVTSGRSSAPIRSDRGGGIVTVEGGSYTSNGQGSPVIYSTADITVSDATLTSNMSEGAVIEGKNSITLKNCEMTVSNTQRNGHAQFLDAIMIYQSFSGDADAGNSHFTMNGGSLTNKKGHLFHVTNTNAIITLNGVKLVNEDPAKVLLSVCADGWQGAGNKATVNASRQQLEGTSISTETGTVNVTLDDDCTWTLTADTYITSLTGDVSHIKANGHRLFVNGKEIK